MQGLVDYEAHDADSLDQDACVLKIFLHFLPVKFLQEVVIRETNKARPGLNLTFKELLRWFGCHFHMALFPLHERKDFWKTTKFDPLYDPPPLHQYMSGRRFLKILSSLRVWSTEDARDPFYTVREMHAAWNENMAKCFKPGWLNCGDELMVYWINRWTCPGWMYVPRKPWPYGNEFHAVACSETGIIWCIDLREGKDRSPHKPAELTYGPYKMGVTAAVMCRLTKAIHGTGRVVVWDSGFCVVEGLIELFKRGVFAILLYQEAAALAQVYP